MKRSKIFTVPRALRLNALRDALAAHHLPAVVKPHATDAIKVTPGEASLGPLVEAFINGFKAGFDSP